MTKIQKGISELVQDLLRYPGQERVSGNYVGVYDKQGYIKIGYESNNTKELIDFLLVDYDKKGQIVELIPNLFTNWESAVNSVLFSLDIPTKVIDIKEKPYYEVSESEEWGISHYEDVCYLINSFDYNFSDIKYIYDRYLDLVNSQLDQPIWLYGKYLLTLDLNTDSLDVYKDVKATQEGTDEPGVVGFKYDSGKVLTTNTQAEMIRVLQYHVKREAIAEVNTSSEEDSLIVNTLLKMTKSVDI